MIRGLFVGLLVTATLIPLYFFYDPIKPDFLTATFFSVATGFVAGMLTPVLLYLATGKTIQEIVSLEFSGILNRIYSEYAPQKVYSTGSSLKSEFNVDLTKALDDTSVYTFVGETGVHVPARILRREAAKGLLRSIEVLLAFPREDSNLDASYPIYGTTLKPTKRVAILASILALREVARGNPTRPVNLFLVDVGLGFRFEETDKLIFLTESPNSLASNSYPVSYRVGKDSVLGRISRNTLTVTKAGAQPINLTTADEEEILRRVGFAFTQGDKDAAVKLKQKLKTLRHV